MVRFKTWLESVERLEAGIRRPLLVEAAAHTSFQAPLPAELSFLASRFVDLGFANRGLGPQKFNDILRAFSGTGVGPPFVIVTQVVVPDTLLEEQPA